MTAPSETAWGPFLETGLSSTVKNGKRKKRKRRLVPVCITVAFALVMAVVAVTSTVLLVFCKSEDSIPPFFNDPFESCNDDRGVHSLGVKIALQPISRFWDHPTANDTANGPPTITYPYIPPTFGDGMHEVTYQATDRSPQQNVRTCRVKFEVVINMCVELPSPLNGYHNCPVDQQLTYDTSCQYTCDPGYEFEPSIRSNSKVLRCELTPETTNELQWSDKPPTCSETTCEILDDPDKGSVVCTNGNKYHSTCTFICEEGYDIPQNLDKNLVCLNNGNWSGLPTTVCKETTCDVLDDPDKGSVVCTNGNKYHSTCTFICEEGYDIPQNLDKNLVCLNNGIWSGLPTTVCKGIFCPTLPYRAGLTTTCTDGTRKGSSCYFSCEEGYDLRGNNMAECESQSGGGAWSNPIPSCQEIVCPPLPTRAGLTTTCTDGFRGGSSCYFCCEEGYDLHGNNMVECESQSDGGVWSNLIPSCQARQSNAVSSGQRGQFLAAWCSICLVLLVFLEVVVTAF